MKAIVNDSGFAPLNEFVVSPSTRNSEFVDSDESTVASFIDIALPNSWEFEFSRVQYDR